MPTLAPRDIRSFEDVAASIVQYLELWSHTGKGEQVEPLNRMHVEATQQLLQGHVGSVQTPTLARTGMLRGASVGRIGAPATSVRLPTSVIDRLQQQMRTLERLQHQEQHASITPTEITQLKELFQYLEFAAYRAAQMEQQREEWSPPRRQLFG